MLCDGRRVVAEHHRKMIAFDLVELDGLIELTGPAVIWFGRTRCTRKICKRGLYGRHEELNRSRNSMRLVVLQRSHVGLADIHKPPDEGFRRFHRYEAAFSCFGQGGRELFFRGQSRQLIKADLDIGAGEAAGKRQQLAEEARVIVDRDAFENRREWRIEEREEADVFS